jgi:hypothetical protein
VKKSSSNKKKDSLNISCCPWHSGDRGFPIFALIILVIGISWLLNDLNIFSFNIPWFPVILIIIAISWIRGHNRKSV